MIIIYIMETTINKELVIAAYDKPLDWLRQLNNTVKKTVYRKGDVLPLQDDEILLDNFGRCVHTFFTHIVRNYDNLSDYTFFAQDYPFDHWENIIPIINGNMLELNKYAALNIGGYFGFHYNTITVPSDKGGIMHTLTPTKHHGNGSILSCYSNGQPHDNNPNINVDSYWDMLFQGPSPDIYEFIPGGHFGITKEQIKIRSKNFYQIVTELLDESVHAPWAFERLECYIFNENYKTKF